MSTNAIMMNGDGDEEFKGFVVLHGGALQSSGIPPIYWRSLHHKITNEIYDAGEVFGIMQFKQEEEDEGENGSNEERKRDNPVAVISSKVVVTRESGLQASEPSSVFLVDHAWTYRVDHTRQQLEQIPGLLHRMAALMGVDFHGEAPDPDTVELVMELMWKYNQTYKISHGSPEDKVPVWYIMDEFGSQVQHSDQPSCSMAPFFYIPGMLAYTVLWPLQDLQEGDEVTRDYTYGETDPLVRQCRLLPWIPADLEGVSSVTTEPLDSYYEAIISENKEQLPVEIEPYSVPKDKILKVYSEMSQVTNNLTHPRFQLTEDKEDADIIWSYNHIKDYRKLSEEQPHVMLNQFPCESIITVKDCLAAVARRVKGGPQPDWLPETFNLQSELPQFIRCYQLRQQRGEDNHWICKPWNLARGLDTHITNNLDYIIRQRESTPKVVCKYIEDPVLFNREEVGMVKFDIRYMLMLRSVQPLRLYAYNVFWLRFANRPFSLDHFDDYQKHFTVMNYADGVELKQVHYDEFIPMFEKQYPQYPWKEVEAEIFCAFKELFQAASSRPPPNGIEFLNR
ncbi:tubulin--tyrosine ligase-like protein 12 isoform X3 [Etheostoma spectabile]|uniref:tubulin--tyrosine ligase-like protein 12 isoform X2 n=1 Tax=Etheostoma spectabile TaxID=54343 RepID=UPI0013AFE673|nr:tubulin--tyrosine ligase-like protein 12 isoform X2 [Etheostoma spectabile]XP_032361196.1 tubulin--tyrosine ligase-like protein 12 isoform X3 [Etheostoma spectabile]